MITLDISHGDGEGEFISYSPEDGIGVRVKYKPSEDPWGVLVTLDLVEVRTL